MGKSQSIVDQVTAWGAEIVAKDRRIGELEKEVKVAGVEHRTLEEAVARLRQLEGATALAKRGIRVEFPFPPLPSGQTVPERWDGHSPRINMTGSRLRSLYAILQGLEASGARVNVGGSMELVNSLTRAVYFIVDAAVLAGPADSGQKEPHRE